MIGVSVVIVVGVWCGDCGRVVVWCSVAIVVIRVGLCSGVSVVQ